MKALKLAVRPDHMRCLLAGEDTKRPAVDRECRACCHAERHTPCAWLRGAGSLGSTLFLAGFPARQGAAVKPLSGLP